MIGEIAIYSIEYVNIDHKRWTMGNIKKILQKIRSPKVEYQPLIEVRIFKDAILRNLNEYQKTYPNVKFAPVLKSNAYGHGLVEVASILDKKNLPFFMVDSFYEALNLRRQGIKTKILVLGYCREKQLLDNSLENVSFGIIDLEVLKNLSAKAKNKINIHLKIDTGMHRQGILLQDITDAISLIKNNSNLVLEGLCTHFADADGPNPEFTENQIKEWDKVVEIFKKSFSGIKYFHVSNTAGSYYLNKIDANVGRLGVGLYGMEDMPGGKMSLMPALEMVSIISSIKTIGAGEKVGYGITFESSQAMKIATVPVGYYEGIDRRLSGKGSFKIASLFCPIVGRVSMNMTSVDVTSLSDVRLEQEVIVISAKSSDENSVENLAKICGCLQREILVHIPQHLRRIIN
jgi:alanine racemase